MPAVNLPGEQVKDRFNEVFWYDQGQYLYDYIDCDYLETAIHPNQIFAISLPFPVLSGERARSVLRIVEEKLLTPFGSRSLAPQEPDYRPQYRGEPLSRDSAYHQGTVWPWLYRSGLERFRSSACLLGGSPVGRVRKIWK